MKLHTPSAVILLALIAGACGPAPESTIPLSLAPNAVPLLTQAGGGIGCAANLVEGDLVIDATAGTAIIDAGVRKPIRWPFGYTGRRRGAEVEVLDSAGNVVAVTGTRVSIGGGETVSGVWAACAGPITIE